MQIEIRPIELRDKIEWTRLWSGYLQFYETEISQQVYDTTFARLLKDGEFEPNGFLAICDNKPVGLVHYIAHRHCWKTENAIYLQDLFTDEAARGKGVARALVQKVYDTAEQLGTKGIYWMTQQDNFKGMALYDKIATKTNFIKYAM